MNSGGKDPPILVLNLAKIAAQSSGEICLPLQHVLEMDIRFRFKEREEKR